jgi:hypothetical protein
MPSAGIFGPLACLVKNSLRVKIICIPKPD